MPVYRRRTAPSIAKINARSIDGYFGEGTPCFFIRGTILSDSQVDGEYRTLDIRRAGNTIEIEDYEDDWAVVSIATREGNRPGDNLKARLRLREVDLRSVGIDVERIMAGFAPFEVDDLEPEPEPAPWPANGTNGSANGHVELETVAVAPPAPPPPPASPARPMQPTIERAFIPEPEPPPVPEPVPVAEEAVAAAAAAPPAAPEAAPEPALSETVVVERIEREIARTSSLFGGASTSLVDGKLMVEVGASVVAIGLPVVLFFMRSLFSKRNR